MAIRSVSECALLEAGQGSPDGANLRQLSGESMRHRSKNSRLYSALRGRCHNYFE
jgi:hypothetical protein